MAQFHTLKPNTSSRPINVTTYKLGEHASNKRVWLQTRYLERIGMLKDTTIETAYDKKKKQITIDVSPTGNKKVSGRSNGMPIIDIKNKQVAETLGDSVDTITVKFYKNRVVIAVSTKEQKRAERKAKKNNKLVEIFCGGGTLSKFAEMAGFKVHSAVEREDKFLEVYEQNIGATTTLCTDLRDLDVNDLPTDCAFLQMGYPCTAYSNSNVVLAKQTKAGDAKAIQARREADYLSLALVQVIRHCNPAGILIEEVPSFLDSTPFDILSYVLVEELNYKLSVQEITGSYTNRKRVAIVAVADGEAIDLSDIEYQPSLPIEAHLETPVAEREFQHISERPREQGALRKGLGIRSHFPSDTKMNTITTHWTRHTHVSLKHPTLEDHYSDFTVEEVRNVHGLPKDFALGDKVTTARAILGQGVVDGFVDVLKRIHQRICTQVSASAEPKPQMTMGQLIMGW